MARPRATQVLLALNLLGFVWLVARSADPVRSLLLPDLETILSCGAAFAPYTIQGEWWRLLTAGFLHFGFIHLAFNGLALLVLGPIVERLLGRLSFVLLFLSSIVAASIAGQFAHYDMVATGASGGVFGLLGAILGYAIVRKKLPPRIRRRMLKGTSILAILNLAVGLAIPFVLEDGPQIDNAAHLGGLMCGIVAGAILSRDLVPSVQAWRGRWFAMGALWGVLAILTWWSSLAVAADEDAEPSLHALLSEESYLFAVQAFQEGDLEESWEWTNRAIERDPDAPRPHWLAAQLAFLEGRYERAVQESAVVRALGVRIESMASLEGYAHFYLGNWEEAIRAFDDTELHLESTCSTAWFAWLARRRMDPSSEAKVEADRTLRESIARQGPTEAHIARITSFLLGGIDEESFRKSIIIGENWTAEQSCEGFYYLGAWASLDGRKEQALLDYRSCVDTGVSDYVEFTAASLELEQALSPSGEREQDSLPLR